jgi:hypothetical protein
MTAGYSGTPLAKKLDIKEGFIVVTIDAPDDYEQLLAPLPNDVTIIRDAQARALARAEDSTPDMIHLFTNSRDELFAELSTCRNLIRQDGAIWVSWHKKAAKLPTEITEDTIREAAFPLGLVDVKVCAVDDKWSGLKLVIRKENRVK